jgi:HD-GYP domain-containing protein (c-di-GMP phosphodiesterase class II)
MDSAAAMLATHARNVELFRESESLFIGVIRALAGAIDAKDPYTCGHSDRVARIAKRLAEELRLSTGECEQVYLAGLLHDIGKIGIADSILCKPGPLTDEEYAEIKKHPVIGFAILRHVQHLQHALPGVLHHHESFDGTGYPGNLKGTETPLLARIIAVADAYDAMTSDRPYRKAMPFEKAEAIFREQTGGQWDGDVVDALFSALTDIRAICSDPNGSRAEDLTADNAGGAPLVGEVESYLEGHLGACLSVFSASQTG